MKLFICDDDALFIGTLRLRVAEIAEKRNFAVSITGFTDAHELLLATRDQLNDPELVIFVDIDMPRLSGFDVASKLSADNPNTRIVFVTNKDELVYRSFEYRPLSFLRKNYLEDELEKELLRLHSLIHPQYTFLTLVSEQQEVSVAIETIWYVESDKNYLLLYRENDDSSQAIRIRMKVCEAECQWKEFGFIRVHRGFLINYNHMDQLTEFGIRMWNGRVIPVSRSHLQAVKKALLEVKSID